MTGTDIRKNGVAGKRAGVAVAACCGLLCVSAQAKPAPYTLVDLGVVGVAGQPFQIANNGIITAAVQGADGNDHAVLFFKQHTIDISQPGLGGTNSEAIGINGWGQVVGGANTPNTDPAGEDFCGFQTLGIATATASCLPFVWSNGKTTGLPTLDRDRGNNGAALSINDLGEVAGAAENTTTEPSCPTYDPANFQFQQYQFKPVIWRRRGVEVLPSPGGDPVGLVKVINNHGQSVGATGTCATINFALGFPIQPLHAVLWEQDGAAVDLGSLGGDGQSLWGNMAEAINDSGHVVGSSSLSDDATFHGFFWTKEAGKMQDLGPIPNSTGIANSFAIAINDKDVVVGVSTDLKMQFVATIWRHGVATDLNTLIAANSPLVLLSGCWINAKGEIVGLALDASGAYHGYELIPGDQ
jgi:probable HAF family extracellular repeat protein